MAGVAGSAAVRRHEVSVRKAPLMPAPARLSSARWPWTASALKAEGLPSPMAAARRRRLAYEVTSSPRPSSCRWIRREETLAVVWTLASTSRRTARSCRLTLEYVSRHSGTSPAATKRPTSRPTRSRRRASPAGSEPAAPSSDDWARRSTDTSGPSTDKGNG